MAERWEPAATAGARASMAANQSGRTKPELVLRAALEAEFGEGSFVCNDRSLPGVPDMAFHAVKLAVFMHGCYWHSCPVCYPGGATMRRPGGTNAELWMAKFVRNEERFAFQFRSLCEAGWLPLVVWECELKSNGAAWAIDVVKTTMSILEAKDGKSKPESCVPDSDRGGKGEGQLRADRAGDGDGGQA